MDENKIENTISQFGKCAHCKESDAIDEMTYKTKNSKQIHKIPLCGYCHLLHTVGEDVKGDGPWGPKICD